jgi:hypothetical protein
MMPQESATSSCMKSLCCKETTCALTLFEKNASDRANPPDCEQFDAVWTVFISLAWITQSTASPGPSRFHHEAEFGLCSSTTRGWVILINLQCREERHVRGLRSRDGFLVPRSASRSAGRPLAISRTDLRPTTSLRLTCSLAAQLTKCASMATTSTSTFAFQRLHGRELSVHDSKGSLLCIACFTGISGSIHWLIHHSVFPVEAGTDPVSLPSGRSNGRLHVAP